MSKRSIRLWRQKRRCRRSWLRELAARRRRRRLARRSSKVSYFSRPRPILQFLRGKFISIERPAADKGRVVVEIPKLFSFIRNPVEANETIAKVVKSSEIGGAEVFLKYENCEDMDLCASLMLGMVSREMTREWRAQQVHARFAGTWSRTHHVNELMRCTGIIKHLNIRHEAPSSAEADKFEVFDLRHGFTPSFVRRSSHQEKEAQALTEYLANCFKRLGLKMNTDAEDDLVELIGEVMDNAERHSSRNEWWAQAYFDQSESSTEGICHLAIVSLGQTIAESLSRGENAGQTAERVRQLIACHKRGSLMGLREPLTEENLLTFYGLQDGVSCTNAPGAGSGTVRLIEHFQQLSRPDDQNLASRMTVISGNTQILFDKKYRMQDIGGRKVIAFNNSNSLEEPPSVDNVRNLKCYFPGTIIALRFQMEKSFLQQLSAILPIK